MPTRDNHPYASSVGVLERYASSLPIHASTPRITLGEGSTPLVRSNRIGADLGINHLYFKLEGCNPTGSFKDRGMVVAVAKAIEEEKRILVCASTGNTSASAAAYGAHCDLDTIVLVPHGHVAMGKLAQAIAYGARIISIRGGFDEALEIVRSLSETHPVALVNSVNPYRIEGQKTAAFEVIDDLGDAPDILAIPVGNAGNITAYWKGFQEYYSKSLCRKLPQMLGFQAAGAAPIVHGHVIKSPQTIASAIRIGNPASWKQALAARDQSSGTITSVTDMEILESYKKLAASEGLFCEPASAASLAGIIKLARDGRDFKDKTVVCVLTGNGLKDPEAAETISSSPVLELPADLTSVTDALFGGNSR